MSENQDVVPRSSNIISDIELCERFYKEALRVTNSLKYRYFSVFEQMTPEDIVMECYVKVLKGNISFDDSKGCKFETFVRMIVTCQLTDELKRLSASKRSGVCISLDSEVPGVDGEETNTLYNTIGDTRSQYCFDYSEVMKDLYDIERELSGCETLMNSIIEMCEEGYTPADISLISYIDRRDIKQKLQDIKKVYYNRCEGTSVLISEILYGDDTVREQRQNDLLSIASFIIDDITGVRLSDVIKLVLKDYSYQGISEKLNMSISDIKRFLSKYETIMI